MYRTQGQHYLTAFAYRFNRHFDLRGLVASLIVDVVQTNPIRENAVRTCAKTSS